MIRTAESIAEANRQHALVGIDAEQIARLRELLQSGSRRAATRSDEGRRVREPGSSH